MAAQALHNQLQKPCLLSVPVSSRFPTMMFCADDRCGDPPSVRQGSVRKVTHEKRTSGSNALLAPTQIFPPHILQGCCFCAWLSSKQCKYSRSSTTDSASKCGHQLPLRLRTHVLLLVSKHRLAHLGIPRQQQRKCCITSYTSFNSRHAHAQHLNAKCESGPTQCP